MVSRRRFLGGISAFSISDLAAPALSLREATPSKISSEQRKEDLTGHPNTYCGNSNVRIRLHGTSSVLWSIENCLSGELYRFAPPTLPIGGRPVLAVLDGVRAAREPESLKNGVTEFWFEGKLVANPLLSLRMVFRIAPENSVVRFRYSLQSDGEEMFALGPQGGPLNYVSTSFAKMRRTTEVQLSNFNALLHSNTLEVLDVSDRLFQDQFGVAGPILIGAGAENEAFLLAYEHGSQMPDTFLRFDLLPNREVKLVSVKGNYIPGLPVRMFDTVWMEVAVSSAGPEELAKQFRTFVCRFMDVDGGSRRSYIFYDTWNFQERNKWWNGKEYTSSYTQERMLAEIDVAHRLRIDVFVMDSGWYENTGDWQVSRRRFPDGLRSIKERLDQYGMQLGLWSNPTMAAVSSMVLATHRSAICSLDGKIAEPGEIWGTEVSYPMCLVSDYSEVYADTLIRVARETGARYFVWDAVAQYGCDSPNHWHGTSANTPKDRSNCYAFQLPLQLVRIAERVRRAFPDVIFDFDITEAGRAVGLSFLSVGRFFLINNGPYLANYDLPHVPGAQNDNLFFYPGPARTWICRQPLNYDKWIPSNLFLTHYFPDDPATSRLVNVASLLLGQNGLWGDLLQVTQEGMEWIGQVMRRYKEVSQDVMNSYPNTTGAVSGSYEVHEKIYEPTGRGLTVLFSTNPGRVVYVTKNSPSRELWSTPGTQVGFDEQGHAVIKSGMESGAAIVFFGVK